MVAVVAEEGVNILEAKNIKQVAKLWRKIHAIRLEDERICRKKAKDVYKNVKQCPFFALTK